MFLISSSARVAELADALDLGSSRETYRGSNPLSRTTCITGDAKLYRTASKQFPFIKLL